MFDPQPDIGLQKRQPGQFTTVVLGQRKAEEFKRTASLPRGTKVRIGWR
jgi:hypothetical protein